VHIGFRVHAIENVSADTQRVGLKVLPPRSDTELVVVGKAVADIELRFDSEFQFIPGFSTGSLLRPHRGFSWLVSEGLRHRKWPPPCGPPLQLGRPPRAQASSGLSTGLVPEY
jgi:hypothetical protein